MDDVLGFVSADQGVGEFIRDERHFNRTGVELAVLKTGLFDEFGEEGGCAAVVVSVCGDERYDDGAREGISLIGNFEKVRVFDFVSVSSVRKSGADLREGEGVCFKSEG